SHYNFIIFVLCSCGYFFCARSGAWLHTPRAHWLARPARNVRGDLEREEHPERDRDSAGHERPGVSDAVPLVHPRLHPRVEQRGHRDPAEDVDMAQRVLLHRDGRERAARLAVPRRVRVVRDDAEDELQQEQDEDGQADVVVRVLARPDELVRVRAAVDCGGADDEHDDDAYGRERLEYEVPFEPPLAVAEEAADEDRCGRGEQHRDGSEYS
ncbi:unnamed protein product, partial [Mycena citricolor]